jgi:hypothetical protein
MLRILTAVTMVYTSRFINNQICDLLSDKICIQNDIKTPLLSILKNKTEISEELEEFIRLNFILQ